MAIRYFEEEGVKARLQHKRRLNTFIKEQVIDVHLDLKKVEINYIFCTDEGLLEKNIAFLNHDTLTDIITFDLSEQEDELQSEIYISVDRVADNAQQFGVSYQKELHRVLFHGILHLCGFKDKKPAEAQEMRRQEDLCLNAYFQEK
ncbi:rRNA maturation RNase YbeY [Taibaiella sp. KBW10]|uniref:rRNA maturation RNase YbeY n=1 Tax=Taibaiella sp. KBW10 TaxID=2153357 RepID=UPI000F5A64B4|nr:rRNA maturation RNase YbeY [Taibaiella sp. KBW10]RQO29694.1 rRNA maturation RNase YbeY [Taibaiella sp. KBW10]